MLKERQVHPTQQDHANGPACAGVVPHCHVLRVLVLEPGESLHDHHRHARRPIQPTVPAWPTYHGRSRLSDAQLVSQRLAVVGAGGEVGCGENAARFSHTHAYGPHAKPLNLGIFSWEQGALRAHQELKLRMLPERSMQKRSRFGCCWPWIHENYNPGPISRAHDSDKRC